MFFIDFQIEVWNKMDLIEDKISYKSALNQDFPCVPVSALYNTNIGKLIETIEEKVNTLMNKKYYTLLNPLNKHKERYDWLYQ